MASVGVVEKKCVIVVDENLPIGVVANTAAVLALSLGKLQPDIIGKDFFDCDGRKKHGITTMPIPTLKANGELLKLIRERLREFESDLVVVDLVGATRTTKSYEEYVDAVKNTPEERQEYLGVAISGSKKLVNKFTGNLALLR